MKDTKYIVIFTILGLVVAYFVGAPLRKPAGSEPKVGAPLQQAKVYAEGTITVSPELAKKAKSYPALFLFARAPETRMPIAVKRYATPVFPLEFSLTEENNMAGDGFYDGDVNIVARLDQDGVAGPRQDGDVEVAVLVGKDASRTLELSLK
jgi:hypothetical protein